MAWKRATIAGEGNASSAGERSPLVLISRAVPLSTSAARIGSYSSGAAARSAVGHVRHQKALHEVDVAHRVEQSGAGARRDLVEVRRDDLGDRPAGDPARDVVGGVRGAAVDVDRPDDEVVGVAGEVVADLGRVVRVPRDLDAEADRHAAIGPALGRLADDALALLEAWFRRSPARWARNRRDR